LFAFIQFLFLCKLAEKGGKNVRDAICFPTSGFHTKDTEIAKHGQSAEENLESGVEEK
jgi:hypothetical protein